MSEGEHLGKASLDLEADLGSFDANLGKAGKSTKDLGHKLDALAEIANIAERALQQIKMHASQATETAHVSGRIDRSLDTTTRKANETRRALESVRLAGGRNGAGVGPFGSGFGRLGVLGTAIGAGTLAAPALAPGLLGLGAMLPGLLGGIGGVTGTLVLALQGVGKAIGGDKKAFDALVPSQQKFVLLVRSMHDWVQKLKQTAGSSLFPGLSQGLQSALSPGTMTAITRAVSQFGHALGQAGAMWGRYFGSRQFQAIFGPLMQSAARNFSVFSRAVLSLFDAFGVLGRAAIPFSNWLSDSAAKGARWVQTYMRAKEASGALGRGLNEAKSSLRLVAQLFVALGRATVALGRALYPVSKIFIKDLTDGLNWLARVINRNREGIRRFITEALRVIVANLKDLVGLIKGTYQILDPLVEKFGGWKTVIEGIIALKFASVIAGWTKQIGILLGVSAAGGGTGLIGALSRLSKFSKFLGPTGVVAAALIDAPSTAGDVVEAGNPYIKGTPAYIEYRAGKGGMKPDAHGQVHLAGGGSFPATEKAYQEGLAAARAKTNAGIANFGDTIKAIAAHAIGLIPPADDTTPSAFGGQPAFTKNLGPKGPKPKTRVQKLRAMLFGIGDVGGTYNSLGSMLDMVGQPSGHYSYNRTGSNLLSTADRLAIAHAKISPGTSDDLKALLHARAGLEAMAKSAHDWLKVPLAEEIGKLSDSINHLRSNMDGFNLTVADQRKHFRAKQFADTYHARHAGGMTYAPTYNVPDEATAKRKDRQQFFHYRQLMPQL